MATILVVDDDPAGRDFLVTLLGYQGHRLLTASDGAEALGIVHAERPELVIADILMPTMDGYEFVRQLRMNPAVAATQVIFYSASYHHKGAHALAEACGVKHLLNKPAEPEVILALVNEVLAGRPSAPPAPPSELFEREHLRLVTDRLAHEVRDLAETNARLQREIVERKQVEGLLEESLQRMQALFQNAQDAIVLTTDSGDVTDANPGACALFGYSRNALLGLNLRQLVPPEVAASLPNVWAQFLTAGKREGEHTIRRADGQVLVVDCRGAAHIISGLHLIVMRDVTDRKRAAQRQADLFEEVKSARERLQVLSRQLLTAQEAERRRLARALHDEIGQALTALKINLFALQRTPAGPNAGNRLEESLQLVEETLQKVRSMSLDLRPSLLDDLGLLAALRWYLDQQSRRVGFAARLEADERFDPPLASDVETACFRVVQEALTNIARHAQAKNVRVELRQSGNELRLTIRDDGVGFAVAAARDRAVRGGSLGLLGMQERVSLLGGEMAIDSAPGGGATVRVRFPLGVGS